MVFGSCECFLFAVMSFAGYVAVCQPLQYIQIMSWKNMFPAHFCSMGFRIKLLLSAYTINLRLTFVVQIPSRIYFVTFPSCWLSCTDTFPNMLLLFALGDLFAIISFLFTSLSYVYIFDTVHRIKAKKYKTQSFLNMYIPPHSDFEFCILLPPLMLFSCRHDCGCCVCCDFTFIKSHNLESEIWGD